jgi:hypothetical protein
MNYSMNPSVEDLCQVAENMREDEIEQFLSVTGLKEYDPNEFVRVMLDCMGEIRFALYDDNDMAYCIGGLVEVRHKVWQTWMMGTEEGWRDHWKSITKLSKRVINDLINSDLCHRVQCYSLHNRHKTHEWYRRGLGLEFESVTHKFFADGQNAVCYIRIKE